MKKYAIFIFSLLLLLLIICTILSGFVEDWMRPRVVSTTSKTINAEQTEINNDAIRTDENGTYVFLLRNLQTDENLLFAQREPVNIYALQDDYAYTDLSDNQKHVLFTTKPILEDGHVLLLKNPEIIEDGYLIRFSEETVITEDILKECGFRDIEIIENYAIVFDDHALLPFFPEKHTSLFQAKNISVKAIYSLYEVNQFEQAITKLLCAGIVSMLILVLGGCICYTLNNRRLKSRVLMIILMAVCFLGLYILLQSIEIPSSLLPERQIFDFAHYRQIIKDLQFGADMFSRQ